MQVTDAMSGSMLTTGDDGAVSVFAAPAGLGVAAEITCCYRDGDAC
jgi:hypothetical protein